MYSLLGKVTAVFIFLHSSSLSNHVGLVMSLGLPMHTGKNLGFLRVLS
jgi:hypothetical protein